MWSAASFKPSPNSSTASISPLLPPSAAPFAAPTQHAQQEADARCARNMRTFVATKPTYDFAAEAAAADAAFQQWSQQSRNPQARTTQRSVTPAIGHAGTLKSEQTSRPAPPMPPLQAEMTERARASRLRWSNQ